MKKPPITVISDPGVDDLVALVLLEKLASKRNKVLISSFGNHNAQVTSKNSRAFAAYMQNGWQYRPGATLPYSKRVKQPFRDSVNGADGLWGVGLPRTEKSAVLNDTLTKSDVFSLGPLTETHQLLKDGLLERLLIMGGTFSGAGNETTFAEFNIALDVDAARMLFENCQDIEVRLVPTDATQNVSWSLADIQRIPETNQTNRWLKKLLLAWFDNPRDSSNGDFVLYDPLAVYLAFAPEAARWVNTGVEVIGTREERGRTVFSDTNPPCLVAIEVLEPKKVSAQIFSLLFNNMDERS